MCAMKEILNTKFDTYVDKVRYILIYMYILWDKIILIYKYADDDDDTVWYFGIKSFSCFLLIP